MMQFIRRWGRLSIAVLFLGVLISILLFLSDILFPFITACFLAYVLFPVIEKISQWKIKNRPIPRGFSVLFVYIIILGALIGGGSYLIPNLSNEITQMIKEMPQAINQASKTMLPQFNEKLNEWLDLFPQNSPQKNSLAQDAPYENATSNSKMTKAEGRPAVGRPTESRSAEAFLAALESYTYEIRPLESGGMEIIPHQKKALQSQKTNQLDIRAHLTTVLQDMGKSIQNNTINFLNLGRQVITQIAGSIFKLFLILMISAFILVDVDRVLLFGESLLAKKYHPGYERFLTKLDQGLNGVVRGQIMICLINGAFTGVGLLIFGVPFVFTLSIVATIASLIPIFGTFLSSFPIVIMALTVSFPTALLIIGWILLIHFIEGNILNPKIIGTAAKIHPALVVFALVAGEHVAGIAGALLAVPVFSLLQTTFFFLKSMIEELEPSTA